MSNWVMKQGDLLPVLDATLLDENGVPINVTGLTVAFHLRKTGATALKVNAACSLVTPNQGLVRYTWVSGDTDTVGEYEGEFEITYAAPTRTLTCPNSGYFYVTINAQLG